MQFTKMWRIKEAPQYEVEQTPGAWVIWGPCCSDEDCQACGGTGSKILDTCGSTGEGASPADPDMVSRVTGLKAWTPERIKRDDEIDADIADALRDLQEE
ncbi:hypothetical protein LCGC14_1776830 [marine sediment metagenome]|uniref:Uncharacterized protein n=1 Tax=marine sediment metagenome TaxID=412755 RepID=A0A0F9HJ52_9ZZZZ